jgi:hypothetical protein
VDQPPTPYQPSTIAVLRDLRERHPDAPFLALGQTVWWDEPVKAVLRRILDDTGLGGRMALGVHDTDYFARAHVRSSASSRYELMAHNDGSTKDLWSAAGEISRLFGSETFPTRQDFHERQVSLAKLARRQGRERTEVVDEATEAWGWRGLVHTGSADLIVHYLPLSEMGPSVGDMLTWGFDGTRELLVDGCCREEARRLGERLLSWVDTFRAKNPDAPLSALYQSVFPRLFELLLGAPARDTEVTCTADLLRFTPATASLPRFRFVDTFLNEKTRSLAARAYNEAVAGSEIYGLDKFGLGAVPFDVVAPGHGRGTLRVTLRAIHVETPEPVRIPLKQPINSVEELAAALNARFGDEVTLVGKAVALISMLAREFIFVFNEEGSAYVSRTLRMNDLLRQAGVDVRAHPILRLKYRTWDSLTACHATLALPDHLAATFGQRQIPASEFGARWREIAGDQCRLLYQLKEVRGTRDLLRFLAERQGGVWPERLEALERSLETLRSLRTEGEALQARVDERYAALSEIKQRIARVEREKGDHFRASYTAEIARLLAERRAALDEIRSLKDARLAIERGPEATEARGVAAAVEAGAARAKLALIRDAVLTRSGLIHTNHRPSAWWLPMVDATGEWFRRVAETTEAYTQPLVTELGTGTGG